MDEETMVEELREWLMMIEKNIPNFNPYAMQFVDKKKANDRISDWRWFISHGYFNKDGKQPEGLASKPTIGYLHGHLKGKHIPLHRDVARCMEPIVDDSMDTEAAARRIMQSLEQLYHYMTPEAIKQDQEQARQRKITDPQKRKEHAEYEKARRHSKKEVATWDPEEYLEQKNREREKARKRREEKKKEALKAFKRG